MVKSHLFSVFFCYFCVSLFGLKILLIAARLSASVYLYPCWLARHSSLAYAMKHKIWVSTYCSDFPDIIKIPYVPGNKDSVFCSFTRATYVPSCLGCVKRFLFGLNLSCSF